MTPPARSRAGRDEAEVRPPRPIGLLAAALLLTLAIVLGPRAIAGLRGGAGGASSALGSAMTLAPTSAPRWAPVPDPRALAAASIAGSVTDRAGAPIAGARACVESDDPSLVDDDLVDDDVAGVRCALTDATGAFAIRGLVPARYQVSASAHGHLAALYAGGAGGSDGSVTLAPGEARGAVVIALAPGGVELRGRVVDASSAPIAGALVDVRPMHGAAPVPLWTRTGLDGAFVVTVAEGEHALSVDAPGYAHAEETAQAPTARATVTMLAGAAIEGQVVAEGTYAPVASALVSIASDDRDGLSRPTRTTRAGADGRFRVDRLVPGLFAIEAEVLGASGVARAPVRVVGGATARDVLIVVRAAHVVQATIVRADGAREVPCEGGSLTLSDDRADARFSASAGADGVVVLRAVKAGTYAVEVACPDAALVPKSTLIVADDLRGLRFVAPAGLSCGGVAVDEAGAPVAGLSVWATREGSDEGGDATTDASGRFTLRGLSPGRWSVELHGDGFLLAQEPSKVDVAEGTVAAELRVTMRRGESVEGTLVDLDGTPVAGADVDVAPIDGAGRVTRAVTREDGSFRAIGLPEGDAEITARLGYDELRGADGVALVREKVRVAKGGARGVKIAVERLSGFVRGRVVDAAGQPIEGALVDANRIDATTAAAERDPSVADLAPNPRLSRPIGERRAITDADGRFRIERLPIAAGGDGLGRPSSAVYDVRAMRPGGSSALSPRVAVFGEVSLTIGEGRTLRGVAVLASGAPLRRFRLQLSAEGNGTLRDVEIDSGGGAGDAGDGAFAIDALHPGTYALELIAPEGGARAKVTVGENDATVRLVVEPLGALRGRLIWFDDGTPVTDGTVSVNADGDAHDVDVDRWGEGEKDGSFLIQRLHPGRYTVRLSSRGHGEAAMRLIEVTAGGDVDLGTVRAARARRREEQSVGWLGLDVQPDEEGNGLRVLTLGEGSPAKAAGLAIGDEIAEVDGMPLVGGSMAVYGTLTDVPVGARVRFTLRDGRSYEVTAIALPEEPASSAEEPEPEPPAATSAPASEE
jgi:protocatechuate 3,4-dioxygenase beta subunit